MDYPVFKLLLFFLLSGFFSCCETAFFSLTPLHLHRIEEEHPLFSGYVRYLMQYPRRLLITIIVGNEVVNALISVMVTALFIGVFGAKGHWMAIAATTVAILIFGEAIPKTLGVANSVRLASLFSPFMMLAYMVVRPVVVMLERITGRLSILLPKGDSSRKDGITEAEFKVLIDAGHQEGALEESQRDIIHRVFELSDKPVSEIMIPRVDMFCLPASLGLEDMEQEIIKLRHSRIPIYGADKDDILGILFAQDLLSGKMAGELPAPITKLIKKPYFVPMEKSAGVLLRELQLRRLKTAIVVDEFGSVSGMVTIEDILEHLFIDVYDEYGIREHLWQRIDDRTMIVSGKMSLKEFNETTGMDIPLVNFKTIGGFIFHLFGKLPVSGDRIVFDNHTFQVEKIAGNRIVAIKVQREEADG